MAVKINPDGKGSSNAVFTSVVDNEIRYLREALSEFSPTGTWPLDYYNRMEFFIYVPPLVGGGAPDGEYNLEVSTFSRSPDALRTSPTSTTPTGPSGQYFHNYKIPHTGGYHKVVLDLHPVHRAADNIDREQALLDQTHLSGGQQYNYFDSITKFFLNLRSGGDATQVDNREWKAEGFRLFREEYLENDAQVYSMSGSAIVGTGSSTSQRITLGWSRNKNENSVRHEVRISGQDIHANGWDSALPVTVSTPPGNQGDNGMFIDQTALPLSLQSLETVWVAVKPEGSDTFKQIELPVQRVPGYVSGDFDDDDGTDYPFRLSMFIVGMVTICMLAMFAAWYALKHVPQNVAYLGAGRKKEEEEEEEENGSVGEPNFDSPPASPFSGSGRTLINPVPASSGSL